MTTGLLTTTKGNQFIFRTDNQNGNEILAWNVRDDYTRGMTHKWQKMPAGVVELFDIDNPPKTVRYLTILN